MAGVILTDSFAVTQSATDSRMRDRRRGGTSLPSRRGRRRISLALHRSRAAFRVALDGDTSPAAASSRLLVFPPVGAARSRRSGRRDVLPARGMTISVGASFVPFCGRVDQLLDPPCHVGELIGSQPIELFCGRLSGSQILEWGGVDGAICPQHASDMAAPRFLKMPARLGPPGGGVPKAARSTSHW